MHPLSSLWEKESRLVIGLMSGTSVDAVDAALVRIYGHGPTTRVEQLSFLTLPFPAPVRQKILSVAGGDAVCADELCRLKTLLGILYGEACEALCAQAGVRKTEIDLIGSHGQTIWHNPRPENYLGRCFASTLQIGEEAEIAARMGCPVVGDFRVRDVAAGGQGAPLVPYTEFLLFREEERAVALQNIGGIGNITVIPPHARLADTVAFDTGPGNMVMDALVMIMTDGAQGYDPEGQMAARGTVSQLLLAWMLEDEYLSRPLPKTTGRELYGRAYVAALREKARALGVSDPDLLATANAFTAESIAVGIRNFAPVYPERLIVGGGGSHNLTLLRNLRLALPGCQVMTGEDRGFSSDAKEAVAFAVLANETLFHHCNNAPAVTGGDPVVMGKLSF